ncbi:MAG: SulP family inorganic anion transporter, partial [Burkholderiales bacterium]
MAHLRSYSRDDFVKDLAAGLTGGIDAMPLALAFGIASGVRPDQGLGPASVAGFLISALGGSRVQIGGPAGAFVALLYTIVEKYGV